MAENLIIIQHADRETQYKSLLPQLESLLEYEDNEIANMANLVAALKEAFNFFWIGFYLVFGEELVLAPFQGPIACTRIKLGRGVCGTAWAEQRTLIVPDVEQFPGHIACNSSSRSEIVVPFFRDGQVRGVLDVDSDKLDDFSETDRYYLTKILDLLS